MGKAAVIVGSVVLVAAVAACVVAVVVTTSHKSGSNADSSEGSGGVSTSVKSIKSICQPTTYKETCEAELTKAVGNDASDKKALIRAALQIPVTHLKEAFSRSKTLQDAAKDPSTADALKQCQALFNSSVYDLEKALDKIAKYSVADMYKAVYDVQTWLSGANTFQDDCLGGFKDGQSEAAKNMKKALNVSMAMTSNGLAMAAQLSKMVESLDIKSLLGGAAASLHKRRLLSNIDSDGVASWGRRQLLQLQNPWWYLPTVIVAQDGSGQFRTIQEGVNAMPVNNKDFVVLFVKAGTYHEQVTVDRAHNKLLLIDEGAERTIISGNLNVALMAGMTTFKSATFSVVADEFMARDITFENTAGPDGHQAVAFRSQSDKSVLLNCHIEGYQDTLYAHAERQFYRNCRITGTVDFIFGNAAAVFQNCLIVVRKPNANQQNIVTAHGSKDPNELTAYVLHNCHIVGEPGLEPQVNPSYLGRPWKEFARTIYLQSTMESVIHPDGWLPWDMATAPLNVEHCFYLEVDNRGPGAFKLNRVRWPGVKHMDFVEALQKFTPENFFRSKVQAGEDATWPQSTLVPFDGALPPAFQNA